jgi:hypothetical protein
MKTIIATTIALLTATSVSANMGTGTATWGGTTGAIHGSGACQFKLNQPGVMSFDGVDTWNVTTNAVVVLKTKGGNTGVKNVKVEAGTKLLKGTTEVADVTVNYLPSSTVTVKNGKAGYTTNRGTTELHAEDINKATGRTKVTFSIGGKATMAEGADSELLLEDTTAYKINHTVTCLQ